MKLITHLKEILFSASRLKCDSAPSNSNLPVVCTETGLVSGINGGHFQDVVTYRGIPYADTTAGDNRWREPQPAKKWNGVKDCSKFGSQCPQGGGGSEDCLFLNIFTSKSTIKNSSNPKPVYLYIYGGGYTFGSANGDYGEYFANKGIVVVTINHRIGALGFMAHRALREENKATNSSGNYGLLDQIYALKWIQRNILEFGGDPNCVTIGGQSSGGGSVYMLAVSPLAKGLFKNVISESGGVMASNDPQNTCISHYSVKEAEDRSNIWLSRKGISSSVTAKELRALPLNKIVDGSLFDFGEHPPNWFIGPALFHPVLDGYVIARTYQETMEKGLQNQVGMIVATAVNTAIREMTRISYSEWANNWLKHSKKTVYQYVWTHGNEAGHGSDISYFFNIIYGDKNSKDQQIADKMSSYIMNFIKTDNPNDNSLPNWPKQTIGQSKVMQVGNEFKQIEMVSDGNFNKKVDFFKRFWATQVTM
uniref:Carboxylic ester hydrolase n=1 Tax=Meloidogyne javanica TaxID=6303 RepID=A0A915LJ75_MELJA